MWLTSRHAIETALRRGARGTLYLSRDKRNNSLERLAERAGVRVEYRSARQIREISGSDAARGAALAGEGRRSRPTHSVDSFVATTPPSRSMVIVLDHIQDPGNVGAILRSADLFRADLVVVPDRRASAITDAVARASAGAAEFVPVATETNLARSIETLKEAGYWVYAADMEGAPSYSVKFAERSVLVIGNEGRGISPLVRKRSDLSVSIPIAGHVDSLNAAVSAAILMYEVRRSLRLDTEKRSAVLE